MEKPVLRDGNEIGACPARLDDLVGDAVFGKLEMPPGFFEWRI